MGSDVFGNAGHGEVEDLGCHAGRDEPSLPYAVGMSGAAAERPGPAPWPMVGRHAELETFSAMLGDVRRCAEPYAPLFFTIVTVTRDGFTEFTRRSVNRAPRLSRRDATVSVSTLCRSTIGSAY
jgi:hypothetical protein